ncbi:YqjD family protein [Terricaulis sp.]|uniref:YqjD family protein n=1 Tax=Terricaulis sp. TaxID=2768686 RepID=UPI003784176D
MPHAFENGVSSKRNGVLRSRANDVIDDFDELRKDIKRLADAATKTLNTHVRETAEQLNEQRHDIQDRLISRAGDLRDDLGERAGKGAAYVSEKVKARPATSIGIALGAGVVLGMLLAPRR